MLLFLQLLYGEPAGKKTKYVLLACLFLNALYASFSAVKEYRSLQAQLALDDAYMLRLAELSKTKPGAKVAYIYNQQDFDRLHTTVNGNYLYHLAYTDFHPLPVNLSCVTVTDFSKLREDRFLFEGFNRKEPFYRYFKSLAAIPGHDPEDIALSFLASQDIHYVLLGPGSPVPAFLQNKTSEVVTDTHLGLRLLVLLTASESKRK